MYIYAHERIKPILILVWFGRSTRGRRESIIIKVLKLFHMHRWGKDEEYSKNYSILRMGPTTHGGAEGRVGRARLGWAGWGVVALRRGEGGVSLLRSRGMEWNGPQFLSFTSIVVVVDVMVLLLVQVEVVVTRSIYLT